MFPLIRVGDQSRVCLLINGTCNGEQPLRKALSTMDIVPHPDEATSMFVFRRRESIGNMADSALQYFCRITLDDHGFQAQTSNLYLANHATLDQGA